MATIDIGIQEREAQGNQGERRVNDFSIQVATVNGSGSQSANSVLLRSIFQMGVPVSGKILIDGNAAAALGSMFAGVTVVTWYPITPSTSLIESLIEYLKEYRITPEGKATFAVVQAEDELAAIGMVLGAGWAGARSMTSTSGPGIS